MWEDAPGLPAEEREALAHEMLRSAGEAADAADTAELAEIERRLDSVDDGTAELVPWSEMQGRLHAWAGAGRGTPRR